MGILDKINGGLIVSCQGLENLSIQGDEFMYIFLQKYPDVVYVYPCKIFALDKALT